MKTYSPLQTKPNQTVTLEPFTYIKTIENQSNMHLVESNENNLSVSTQHVPVFGLEDYVTVGCVFGVPTPVRGSACLSWLHVGAL